MPFSANESLREKFTAFHTNGIRTGRLLELLDYLAGEVGYKFCNLDMGQTNQIIVTVCVDNVQFFGHLEKNHDLTIDSYVTHTGNSTIEVRTDLLQQNQLKCTAIFLMASRDHVKKQSIKVPKVNFNQCLDIEKAMLRYELGDIHQQQRIKSRNYSVFRQPPSADESILLHKMFMEIKNNNQDKITQEQNKKQHFICDSLIEKNLIMHIQERNLHGNVFGGYLMRQAFELGWLCAVQYLQGRMPTIYHIDDVLFQRPVNVGSVLNLRAKVIYTHDKLVCVIVQLNQLDYKADQKFQTTELHLQFLLSNEKDFDYEVPQIYPKTYEDAMYYLEGKRRIDGFMDQWTLNQDIKQ